MTSEFNKFMKWTVVDKTTGYRKMKPETPEKIKQEAKKANEDHIKRTGRQFLQIDY